MEWKKFHDYEFRLQLNWCQFMHTSVQKYLLRCTNSEILHFMEKPIKYRSFEMFWSFDWTEKHSQTMIIWAASRQTNKMACAPSEDSDQPGQWVAKDSSFLMRTAKPLIRLGGCPGWSESSLGAHSFCWFCHVVAHIRYPSGKRSRLRFVCVCKNTD